ncbi:MAG: D-alanyl-D-alanine carboxypeptidase family protein [Acidimicrobiia bacterium]
MSPHRIVGGVMGLLLMLVAMPGVAIGLPPDPLPPRPGWVAPPPPPVSAPSWVLFDDTTDWLIASRGADDQRPPASTTKMMTALVAADRASFDDLVTVSATAADAGEAEIGLVVGEVLTMGDLLSAMLVRSANDAAVAVAEHIGGSIEGFADLMNDKAVEMGLTNTHFTNPHGLDEPGHYSSAADLLEMARAILANPQLAAIVRSRSIHFPAAPDETLRGGKATNTLLDTYDGAIGVKTGFTFRASLVLAGAAERNGRVLLAVVMGSEGVGRHFADAGHLLDYGFETAAITVSSSDVIAAERLAAAARVEAMTWLGVSGLLVGQDLVPSPVEITNRGLGDPPGWREAFSWGVRYWAWLTGDR